jgi:hypothetical protein
MGPPEGGWPNIIPENFQKLGKTDEVIRLLRNLPYISSQPDNRDAKGTPLARFLDWQSEANMISTGERDLESTKVCSQGFFEHIPPHVVGFSDGEEDIFSPT